MSRIAAALPLLALITCFMTIAVVFVFLNGPLLTPVLNALGAAQYATLVADRHVETWSQYFVPSSRTLLDSSALLLAALALGFVLNAISQMLAFVVGYTANVLARAFRRPEAFFVSGIAFLDPGYARFSYWINREKAHKIQWEWEMFNHYLYWGITFSLLFHLCAVWLIQGRLPLAPALLAVFLILYCLLRGRTLKKFLAHGYHASEEAEHATAAERADGITRTPRVVKDFDRSWR